MPVTIIDTLKPKNNGSFPIVEAVDVAVSEALRLPEALEAKADAADLAITNTTVSQKADKVSVEQATSELQGEIDQIVISASAEAVVAPEVAQARVDSEGTTYSTLKDRLDSSDTRSRENVDSLRSDILNTDNLLLSSIIVPNKYYVDGERESSDFTYAIIPMLASKTYVISAARFIAYASGSAVETNVEAGFEFSPSSDTNVYVTFSNNIASKGEWYVYEKGKDASRIGTYQHPALSETILANDTGDNKNVAMSQKAVTDIFNEPINVKKISDTSIMDGTDLSPYFSEQGDGGYIASGIGGTISEVTYSGYKYFKLPVNGSDVYYLDNPCRWWFATDSSGNVVDCVASGVTSTTEIKTSSTASILWVTYSTSSASTRKIAKKRTPSPTVFLPPAYFKDKDVVYLSRAEHNVNLFDDCQIVYDKYYYSGNFVNNESYDVLIFSVKAGKSYQFGCPLRFLCTEESDIGANLPSKYIYTAPEDMMLYCSISKIYASSLKVVELPNDVDKVNPRGLFSFNPDLIAQGLGASKSLLMSQYAVTQAALTSPKLYGKGFAKSTGNLSDGDSLTVPKTNVKKNNVYSFMAYITGFDKLLIGHGKNKYSGSWAEITSEKIIVHNYFNADGTDELTHGLTLSDYIYVQITVSVQKATIKILSNGETYESPEMNWYGDGTGDTFAESDGSTLTDCVFTWSSSDFRKSIWMFGDSYFSMTSSKRWVKYLIDAGYEGNVLLNAYPGENTSNALTSLNNMIEYYGVPNMIVWCLGMNDGSDNDSSTPSSSWMSGYNRVIELCEQYAITPVFSTIPTVPDIYHEAKNNFVRNSGHRYIDFAKAVGASGDGTWFEGMLSSDEVHPDTAGAIALYHRAIADCPEITFSNP